jgi:beta-N-acetylhexosaminidase
MPPRGGVDPAAPAVAIYEPMPSSRSSASFLAAAVLTGLACSACSGPRARLASLELPEKASQVLLIGVEGAGKPSASTEALLGSMPFGGVVLFGLNLPGAPIEAAAYTAALQDASAAGFESRARGAGRGGSSDDRPIPLIVAIDHEGGSVFRFKGEGITRLPPPSEVGAMVARQGSGYALQLGRVAGAELRSLGFTMNLAPVVELLTDGNEAFLGSRSYGRSASAADASAAAFIEGLQSERVAAVAKHFPGNAGADPHKVLPELGIGKAEYLRDYRPRFASAVRAHVSSVMLSHVLFPALDPDRPSSLSPVLVQGELRGALGFRGLAVTDDLCMRALSSGRSLERSAVEALAAGADLLMLVDMGASARVRDAIVQAVREGRLPASRLDEAVARVLGLKSRYRMDETLDSRWRARRLADFPALVREDARRLRRF